MLGTGEKAEDPGTTLLRLWGYLRNQGWRLVLVAFLVVVATLLGLAGPYLMGVAVDKYMLTGDLQGLAKIALLLLASYVAGPIVSLFQGRMMADVAQNMVRDLRNDLFAKLQTLSLAYFDRRTHGELMSRLINDIENVSIVLNMGVSRFLSSAFTLLGVTVMMLMLNARLAAVTLIAVPIMVFITKWISKKTRRGYRDQQSALGRLNGHIEETISGQRVVKAYGREDAVTAAFEAVNVELREAAIRAQSYGQVMGPLGNLLSNVSLAIVAAAGGWLAVAGWATVGMVVTFVNYAQRLIRPMNEIASLYNTIQSALAGAERVFEVLDEEPDVADSPDARPLVDVKGDVVFDNVSFSYEEDVSVLRHVSLHAEPGQTIALVGPTGAGKTTIINLLSRFYDIDDGRILIDGVDIRDYQKAPLRRALGIVLQDTFLFSESVMDNIRYGRLDATDEEVMAAAKLANAHHFIQHLPKGYQTKLSERASNLSLGQRQLLAIARAVLADPSILILDEATSSVDTRTEQHIQEALLRLMEGRTSFVIAHRLSTVRDADCILVILDGQVVERGRHEQLLERRGFYHDLYMSQFKGRVSVAV